MVDVPSKKAVVGRSWVVCAAVTFVGNGFNTVVAPIREETGRRNPKVAVGRVPLHTKDKTKSVSLFFSLCLSAFLFCRLCSYVLVTVALATFLRSLVRNTTSIRTDHIFILQRRRENQNHPPKITRINGNMHRANFLAMLFLGQNLGNVNGEDVLFLVACIY